MVQSDPKSTYKDEVAHVNDVQPCRLPLSQPPIYITAWSPAMLCNSINIICARPVDASVLRCDLHSKRYLDVDIQKHASCCASRSIELYAVQQQTR